MSNHLVHFLVDRDKHRIVKRDGLWCLYCPELEKANSDSVIYTNGPFQAIIQLPEKCPHGKGVLFQ